MNTARGDAIRSLRLVAGRLTVRLTEPPRGRNLVPFSPEELRQLRDAIVAATDTLAAQQDGG